MICLKLFGKIGYIDSRHLAFGRRYYEIKTFTKLVVRSVQTVIAVIVTAVVGLLAYIWWLTYMPTRVIESGTYAGITIGQTKAEILSSTRAVSYAISPVPKPRADFKNWWYLSEMSAGEQRVFFNVSQWELGVGDHDICPINKPCASTSAYFQGDRLDRIVVICSVCK